MGTIEKHGADTTTLRFKPNFPNHSSIDPTVLAEAWDVYGEMMPGFEPVPSKLVGKAFERSVDGFLTGEVIFVDA